MYEFVIDILLKDDSQGTLARSQAIEQQLETIADNLFDVDGNEFGSGSYDIFLSTDHPRETLDAIMPVLADVDWQAGYKPLAEDEYTPIYPRNLRTFELRYEVPPEE